MAFTERQEEAVRAIVGLPEDDWQPMDWATFSVARDRLADELASLDRSRGNHGNRSKPKGKRRVGGNPPELQASRLLVAARSGGFCEASLDGCTVYAQHVHHKAGRRGPHAHDAGNLLHVCLACHESIHANPERSYAEGWMVKRLGSAS